MGPGPLGGVWDLPLGFTGEGVRAPLRARFVGNWGGALNSTAADWAKFKEMVTNAAGTQTAMTLVQLGIAQINLKTDATEIGFVDGSVITGQSTFVKNGLVQTAGAVTLVTEADGHKIETSVDGAVATYLTKDADGHVGAIRSVGLLRNLNERRKWGMTDHRGPL